jgi:hypothetical protein
MPACFQLIDRQTGQPAIFQQIDDKMRESFGAPPNDKEYMNGWYDSIGFRLALGKTWNDIRDEFELEYRSDVNSGRERSIYPRLISITNWLEDHYESSSWYQRHKD